MFRITFLLLLSSASAFAQQPYTIEGTLKNVPDGAVISLMRNEGNLLSEIAKDTVKGGKFRFDGSVDALTSLGLSGRSSGFPSMWLDLWVKPGSQVKVTGNRTHLKTWTVKSDIPEQKDQQRFMSRSKALLDQYQELSVQESALFEKRGKVDKSEHPAIRKSIDSIRKLQEPIQDAINRNELSLLESTSQHGTYWMKILKERARFSKYSSDTTLLFRTKAIYHALSEQEKSSYNGAEIRNLLYPPTVVKVGEKIADTELKDLQGNTHSLAEYKGKYLLIDFWSIGCGPCIAAMPELKKLHESAPANLAVISLSVDERTETWKKASDKFQLNWINLSDGKGMTGLAANYGVTGIPHYVIISPDGVLLDSWVGYSEGALEKRVGKFLGR
ncbi:AhpC/TSA family protein [Chitinophaga horti]|uniref:AhpC/TSA family protein n=1 Tax=Chitinophaga horti TaxID=2920382 RepID=A0ABY6J5M5_9BACT|nr:TlpA disulfide reductase family protein [Chitinophaga horti]UYQ94983.1 AhpC/TSA family protein [Chitinophaga horti]